MAVRNTCTAAMLWNGAKVAKVTNLTLSLAREALDTTGLGECDSSFASGRRTTTATARVLYDPENAATTELMNRILQDDHEASDRVTIVSASGTTTGTVSADCVVTSAGIPYAVGELVAADISLQLSGKLDGFY